MTSPAPRRTPRPPWRTPWRSRALARLAPTLLAVGLASGGAALPVAPAAAAGGDVVEQALRVPVGPEPAAAGRPAAPVSLDVSVFTGRGATGRDATGSGASGRRPAVLLAHGFGGSKADLAPWARTLARAGYVAMTFSARGFARSGGLIHLDSPAFEVRDASRLLDVLAARPDVTLDAPGDPRVGVAGGSYGGALALLLAGTDARVDAAVPAITWNDLGQALLPQYAQQPGPAGRTPAATDPAAQAGVLKQRWASLFFASGALGASGAPGGGGATGAPAGTAGVCGRFAPEVCAAYTATATTGRPDGRIRALLAASSPQRVLASVRAPTLLVQGEQDSLFGLDQADANARGIAAAGTPVAVRWVSGGHDATGADAASLGGLQDEALRWFGRYLRRDGSPVDTTFRYVVPPSSTLGADPPEQRVLAAYPGLRTGTTPRTEVPLAGGAQQVLSPPGASPAAVTGLPGTGALLGAVAGTGALSRLGILPGQSAVFAGAPLLRSMTVAGTSRVRLQVTSSARDATLFVGLWDATATRATLPAQLVSPVRLAGLTPGRAVTVDVALPAVVRTFAPGHRLQVVVSSTDQAYAAPRDARTYRVALAGAALSVPTPAGRLDTSGRSLAPTPLVAVLAASLLAVLVAALWRRRSRRRVQDDPALADVPLAVQGLVKTYRDGQLAVDDVSWQAGPGQVVGLLGPNGAGKTTTLRMVVGLVRPDAGTVHVLGRPVTPGAAVLGDVGVLIEGPGFLPHLTGRQNLEAYWAATGRPAEEAHLEEALEVAALGAAVDRRTRAYSQGMRQRLGIAQAMLGRPRLLLLDEPTNGLDPPQILAMRGALRDYAATGRTVVVSSHLLGEVEQTCSHVVVMHQGHVVTAGSVAELTGGSGGRHLEEVFMQLLAGVGAR